MKKDNQNQVATVELKVKENYLNRILSQEVALQLKDLKLIGSLNSSDILYLSQILRDGMLETLDLSSVKLATATQTENIFCDVNTLQKLKLSKNNTFLNCFNNCINLIEVEIIASQNEELMNNCFNGCPQIKKIEIKASNSNSSTFFIENSFDMAANKFCNVYVPDKYRIEYAVAPGWHKFNIIGRKDPILKRISQIVAFRKKKNRYASYRNKYY